MFVKFNFTLGTRTSINRLEFNYIHLLIKQWSRCSVT